MFILRSLGVLLSTIFWGSASLATSFFDPDGRRQNALARIWAKSLLRVAGVRLTVEGVERIDPEGAYVISPNHVSYFDTPVLLSALPVQFRFMAKKGLFHIPLLGTHLQRAGHIPVHRDNPRAGVKTMIAAAETIRTHRVSVLVFPEGGRTHDGELHEFKEGAAYIAIRAGVPIVPVAIIGTRQVLPFGGGRIRSAAVTLRVGEPVPTEGLSLRERDSVTATIRERIVSMLGEAN